MLTELINDIGDQGFSLIIDESTNIRNHFDKNAGVAKSL